MIVRFVRFVLTPEALPSFRERYQQHVVPALAATEGCLFASLWEGSDDPEATLSLTIWRSPADLEAYEASGLYDRLLDENDALGGSAGAALQDPQVDAFPVAASAGLETLRDAAPRFLRTVEALVEPGKSEDLLRRYQEVVLPELLSIPGCRALLLADTRRPAPSFLSVTFWDSEEESVRYEISGRFDRLAAALREFFSGAYQWRFSPSEAGREVLARDLSVHGFRVLAGPGRPR